MRGNVKQLFLDHQDLLNQFAWSYHRSTGIELEEIQNQARYLFFKAYKAFNKGDATFITFLYTVLKNDLHRFCKTYRKIVCVEREILEREVTALDPSHLAQFKLDVLCALSEDAQEAAEIILSGHDSIDFTQSHTQIRMSLKSFLKEEYGWTNKLVKDVLAELKGVLK